MTDAEVVASLPREAGGDGRSRGGAVEASVIVKMATYALPQRRLDLVLLSQRDDRRSLHLPTLTFLSFWNATHAEHSVLNAIIELAHAVLHTAPMVPSGVAGAFPPLEAGMVTDSASGGGRGGTGSERVRGTIHKEVLLEAGAQRGRDAVFGAEVDGRRGLHCVYKTRNIFNCRWVPT